MQFSACGKFHDSYKNSIIIFYSVLVIVRDCSLLFGTVFFFILNFYSILHLLKKSLRIILYIFVFVIVFSCPELAVTVKAKICH